MYLSFQCISSFVFVFLLSFQFECGYAFRVITNVTFLKISNKERCFWQGTRQTAMCSFFFLVPFFVKQKNLKVEMCTHPCSEGECVKESSTPAALNGRHFQLFKISECETYRFIVGVKQYRVWPSPKHCK